MIVIVSQHEAEHTTCVVIDWLNFLGADYLRINGLDALCNFSYTITSEKNIVEYLPEKQELKADVVWYRRWTPQDFFVNNSDITDSVLLNIQFRDFFREENRILARYFMSQLSASYLLSDFSKTSVNKLGILKQAAGVGLKIPNTIVTAKKTELQNFIRTNESIIVKNIYEIGMFSYLDKIFVSYTTGFEQEDVKNLPETFFPAIFQSKVDKLYELRIFYLEGMCYSMAIFSQENDQTKADFRVYDFEFPNRNVPYKLPAEEEEKIDRLMKKIGLNCGSIDMIRSSTGEYFFLEINPVGQFGMVSDPCNYFLERKVAELLIKMDKN